MDEGKSSVPQDNCNYSKAFFVGIFNGIKMSDKFEGTAGRAVVFVYHTCTSPGGQNGAVVGQN